MERFANFLKELRIRNGLTQVDACDNICSRREYQRYESGLAEPSMFHLRLLSSRFGYDLIAYYALLANTNGEMDILTHKRELIDLYTNKDFKGLHRRIKELSKLNMYDVFENQKLLLHFDALYYSSIGDYVRSNELCLSIINDEDPKATIDFPCGACFSEEAVTAINLIATNYTLQNNEPKSIEISRELIAKIEQMDREHISHYQDKAYRVNLHQVLLLNLSIAYMRRKDYVHANEYIDRAIDYARTYSTLYLLPRITRQKMKIEYAMKDKKEAVKYRDICRSMYMLYDEDKLDDFEQMLRSDYPDLLD